jgi:FMN-dependent NADH-azoreductase
MGKEINPMKILQINSSIQGDDAASTQLASAISSSMGGKVKLRELAIDPIPHLNAGTFAAFNTPPETHTPEQVAGVARSDQLIDELREADAVVLAVPMYNFGIPSSLKAWIDHVARAGVTFRYTAEGPEGLLGDKRVIVVATRGGTYAGTDADNQSAYLRQVLGFIGLGEPEFVYAEGLANAERREQVLGRLNDEIAEMAA